MKKKKTQDANNEQVIVGAKPLTYLSTGFASLDRILGGGWAKGKIYEIWCPPGAGKTTFMVQSAASVTEGYSLYVDAERALDSDRIKQLGGNLINLNEKGQLSGKTGMLYIRPDNGEAGYAYMENLIETGCLSLVVVDSAPMMTPQKALEVDVTDETYALEARLMSKVLKRLNPLLDKTETTLVIINQVRANVDGGLYSSKYVTPCGYVLEHLGHARIELRHTESIKKGDETIGSKVRFLTKKCRSTSPQQEFVLPLYFATGFDKRVDKLEEMIRTEEIQKAGGWYYYKEEKYQGLEAILEAIK